ncbi:MAG: type I pullulanase [Ruminococcus sp.]|nr:type I pullulanase [Ruminococcus sp.]
MMNYNNNDLGCTYFSDRTIFKVWSPDATEVRVQLFKTGSDSEPDAQKLESYSLKLDYQTGIWSVTVFGDLKNLYYTYLVTVNGTMRETQDVYSKAVGVNGKRSMVCDMESTNPAGWNADKHVFVKNSTDAVIWEVHVGDFSGSPSSGVSEKNRGKYLAFTERGTTLNSEGNIKTCVDYLLDLGITHVHLNPVYDFDSVDESKPESDQYNWGYDPANYNVPEGSYSSNPYDGNVRINEFKQMVQALHSAGIGVIMDVVYNHTSSTDSCFNRTVPDYYYRKYGDRFLNSSGCGNAFASEKEMARNYIVNSVVYWANEYHIDGFRFDLMGCIDTTTMNLVRLALDEIDPRILIYGEPWTANLGDNGIAFEEASVKENAYKLSSRIAMFNDSFRNALKGNTDDASIGYIQGNNHNIYYIISGILACSSNTFLKWAKKPTQCVTYNSAHDNLTLWDKLLKSSNRDDYDTTDEHIIAMNKLSAALVFTSQGIPFILAGEEMARTKRGDHNSYRSPLSTNAIDWNRARKYKELVEYYKGLIAIRKAYSPLREPTTVTVSNTYFETNGRAIAYTVPNITHGEWDMMAILFNNSNEPAKITLKSHTTLPHSWVIITTCEKSGFEEIKRIDGNDINVPPMSTLILVDDKSFDRIKKEKDAVKKEK